MASDTLSLSHRRPGFEQRSFGAVYRVFARPSDFGDCHQGALMVLAARALVIPAEGRIGADHQEILAGGQALMSGASRQDGDVTCFQLQGTTATSAELHL